MAILTAPTEFPATAASTSPGRVLRVSRGGEPAQTYQLADGKCTIGSSPRCQVCLPAGDARPLQCLLILEADAATVTRWAAGVLLNGQEFATAPLADGDRLSIGSWEIALGPPAVEPGQPAELVSANGAVTEDFSTVAQPSASPPHPSQPEAAAPELSPKAESKIQTTSDDTKPPAPHEKTPPADSPTPVGMAELQKVEDALAQLTAEERGAFAALSAGVQDNPNCVARNRVGRNAAPP